MKKLKLEELNRINVDEFKKTEKHPFVFVLDNIRSFNNVGSAFRTADALLAEKICLCGITATPPHRDIHKTALGATESVDWKYYKTTTEAIEELQAEGYIIVGVEQTDSSIMLQDFKVDSSKKYALIMGNEVKGVDDAVLPLLDDCIEIPQFGIKHSFNVSVTMGIVGWDLVKQYKFNSPPAPPQGG